MIFNLNTGLKLRFHESGREQNSSLDDHVLYDQNQVFYFGPKPILKPKMAVTLVPIAKLTETTKFHYDHMNTEHDVPLTMNHCFWTELSVCCSTLCGLALAILVL